jgi:uncharacterized protein DUF6798
VDPSLYPGDPLLAERPFYYTYLWDTLGLLHARSEWTTTHFVLAMLIVASVVVRRPGWLRRLATGLLAFLAVASPLLVWRLRRAPPSLDLFAADPGWLEALRLRSSPHMFPLSWGPPALVHGLVTVSIFLLAARLGDETSDERHVVVRSAVWTIIALCLAGIVFAEWLPMGVVFLLQPLRSFAFLESGWREGRLARHFAAATACLACLSAWACYLDDERHGGSDFSIDVAARPGWRDVQHWAKAHTEVRDAFIVPPDEDGEFRVEGERTVYGDWEEGGLMNGDPVFGRAWLRRMRALGYEDAASGGHRFRALGVSEL